MGLNNLKSNWIKIIGPKLLLHLVRILSYFKQYLKITKQIICNVLFNTDKKDFDGIWEVSAKRTEIFKTTIWPEINALTTKIKVKRKKNLDCIDSRHLYLLYFQSVLWDSWEENNAFEEYIAFDA